MKKENKNKYNVLLLLVVLVIISIIYTNYRISKINTLYNQSFKTLFNLEKDFNSIIKINKLDTEKCKFLIDSEEWEKKLSDNTGGLTINIPDGWSIIKTEILACKYHDEPTNEFEMYLNMGGDTTFNDFTNLIFKEISVLGDEVMSFKENTGYYTIHSFEEATYNNMYYDYLVPSKSGLEEKIRTKIKILNLGNETVKIEINKF